VHRGQPGAEIETVPVREVHVKEHHVRREALHGFERRGDRTCLSDDAQTAPSQQAADQAPRALRVVDDQDPCGAVIAAWGERAYTAQC
jgi:hypothetical protein